MLKATHVRAELRKPVKAPTWWEGHVIHYMEYPLSKVGKHGLCTVNLSSRDGGKQKRAPYKVGDFITASIGGVKMRGQISDIEIDRPGWNISHGRSDTFNPDDDPGEWIISLDIPRIHLGS